MLAPDICHCPRGDAKVNLLRARLGFSSSRRIKEAKNKKDGRPSPPLYLLGLFPEALLLMLCVHFPDFTICGDATDAGRCVPHVQMRRSASRSAL